jgi:hypothetical protein
VPDGVSSVILDVVGAERGHYFIAGDAAHGGSPTGNITGNPGGNGGEATGILVRAPDRGCPPCQRQVCGNWSASLRGLQSPAVGSGRRGIRASWEVDDCPRHGQLVRAGLGCLVTVRAEEVSGEVVIGLVDPLGRDRALVIKGVDHIRNAGAGDGRWTVHDLEMQV